MASEFSNYWSISGAQLLFCTIKSSEQLEECRLLIFQGFLGIKLAQSKNSSLKNNNNTLFMMGGGYPNCYWAVKMLK